MTGEATQPCGDLVAFARLAQDGLLAALNALDDVAFCLLDPDGRIATWNAAAQACLGFARNEVLGQPLEILHQAEDIAAGQPAQLRREAVERGHVRTTARYRRRDGRSVLLATGMTALSDPEGRHLGFALTMRAPSGGDEASGAVAASEARYRALFDHAPIGIVHADADSRYIDANASACGMLGYTREEFVGLSASDIIEPAEHERIAPAIGDTLAPQGHRRRWRFRRKDGASLVADVVALAMPDGTLLGLLHDRSDLEAAQRYRDHLAAIVESSSDAIVGEDLDGNVTSWNAAAEALFGYTAAEMLGRPIIGLLPADRQREDALSLARILRGEAIEPVETQRRTRLGNLVDVSISTSRIMDGAGRVVGVARLVRDITQLKAREREVARLTRLYAALSHINKAIVWASDRASLFDRICGILVDEGGFRMAWIGWEDAGTQRLVPVAIHGDRTGYLRDVEIFTDGRPEGQGPSGMAFRAGRSQICNDVMTDTAASHWRARQLDHGFRSSVAMPLRLQGRVCGTLNVYAGEANRFGEQEVQLLEEAAADVSFALDYHHREDARRAAEEQLRSEKLFSDTIIESLPGVVYFYDRDGRFLRWNRNFERVTGYSAEEIASMSPRDFFAEEHRALVEARIADVFAVGEAAVEAPLLARDGTLRPHLLTGRRVEFAGSPCLVGAGVDITERERRHRAEAADRVKSAFLANMSHELRTPLNSIIGFTGILLQGLAGPLNDEQSKQLGMVRNSARHLLALVNDVLDISKIEAGQLRIGRDRFEPTAVIRQVAQGIEQQAAAKGLRLSLAVPADLLPMRSDERRFAQILINLLSNAIKFTEHGDIRLEVEQVADASPALRVTVTDTGIGIRPADMAALFQPFQQIESGLSRRSEGTGLGLAICRRLATLMGGTIEASSEWGRGSRFTLVLPVEAPAP